MPTLSKRQFMKNNLKTTLVVGLFALAGIFSGASSAFATNPTITTLPANPIASSSATLNASWNGNGASTTTVWFKYGTNPLMTSTTPTTAYTTASGTHTANISVVPGTTYYFQAVGAGDGFGTGATLQFTVPALQAPTVLTLPAISITSTGATLKGNFVSNGQTTTTWFKYANNASLFGATTTFAASQSGTSGTFTQAISGLAPNTTYYFKAYAQNAGGTATATTTLSFTTTNGNSSSNTCIIDSFTAGSNSIASGDSTTLSWNTTNCTNVTLLGNSVAIDGSQSTGALYTTTTYTLNASNSSGNTSSTVTVTVGNTSNGNDCTIDFFNAPNEVDEGDDATLEWETTNCTSVYLSGDGVNGTYSADDSVSTNDLWNDETFTITAYGSNGSSDSDSETISVDNNNSTNDDCEIDFFDVSDTSISSGDTVDLEWETVNCDDVSISGPVDGNNFDEDDETESDPLYTTTTFTLYADGDNGSDSNTVTVYVNGNNQTYYPTYTPPTYVPPTYTQGTNTIVNQTVYSGTGSGNNWLNLKVEPRSKNACPRDAYDTTVTYKNNSGVTLNNVVIRVTVPSYVTFRSSTAGTYTPSDRTVTVQIASLPKSATGTIYLTGDYGARSFTENRVVTTATASFVHSTKNLTDDAIAYGVQNTNTCRDSSNLAGLALFGGDGFMPTTIIGWLILILAIAVVLIIVRELYGPKRTGSAHH